MQSVFHHAKTLKRKYTAAISLPWHETLTDDGMQSVFDYAKTLKGEYSAAIRLPMVPNLNGRWFASNLGRAWTTTDTVLQGMQPSAGSLTGRPPDTVLQGMQPSAR